MNHNCAICDSSCCAETTANSLKEPNWNSQKQQEDFIHKWNRASGGLTKWGCAALLQLFNKKRRCRGVSAQIKAGCSRTRVITSNKCVRGMRDIWSLYVRKITAESIFHSVSHCVTQTTGWTKLELQMCADYSWLFEIKIYLSIKDYYYYSLIIRTYKTYKTSVSLCLFICSSPTGGRFLPLKNTEKHTKNTDLFKAMSFIFHA